MGSSHWGFIMDKIYSKNKALLTAIFLGLLGVHNFVWGKPVQGFVKIALFAATIVAKNMGQELADSVLELILAITVFVDLFSIKNGTFFQSNNVREASGIVKLIMYMFILCIGGLSLYGLKCDVDDALIKDSGKTFTPFDIAEAYYKNEVSADAFFTKNRFNIEGQVAFIKSAKGINVMLEPPQLPNKEMFLPVLNFPTSQKNRIALLQPGSSIKASCIGKGAGSGMFIATKCKIKL